MVNNKVIMKFIATTSKKLDDIKIKDGQLIFTTDNRTIYLDTNKKRTPYAAIMTIVDEETRENLPSPIEGFYYVRSDSSLWSYFQGIWNQLTGQEPNLQFMDGGLPAEGQEQILYVDKTTLYRWNSVTHSYDQIVGGAQWENLVS